MIGYVIIFFQSISKIFYLISSLLKAILMTVGAVISCLKAFFVEVELFFTDVNKSATDMLDCIAEEATQNMNNIAKFATTFLSDLSKLTSSWKQQWQNISDAIALATIWSGKTLNGALLCIGDTAWTIVIFILRLLLMPVLFVCVLITDVLNVTLLLVATIGNSFSRMPVQSMFALALIVTVFKFRRRIQLLFRVGVIWVCNKIYRIFRYRRNFRRLPAHENARVVDGRRNRLRSQRSLLYRVFASTKDVLLQVYNIFLNRENRPAEEIYNQRSQSAAGDCGGSGLKFPMHTNSFDNFCVVCQERPKCVVLLPCKHFCLCKQCSRRIEYDRGTCPLCRICIRSKLNVYI